MRAGAGRRPPAAPATLSARAGLALLNRVLGAYGCSADDWAGAHYMVHKASGGATEMASDLPTLWAAVEGLTGRAPDPLDPALVAALDDAPPNGRKGRGREAGGRPAGERWQSTRG